MASFCGTCDIVGTCSLKLRQQQPESSSSPSSSSLTSIYNLGHHEFTTNDEEVKDKLMERYYKKIFALKHLSKKKKKEYEPGMIGVHYLPMTYFSKIPEVNEPQMYRRKVHNAKSASSEGAAMQFL